MTSITIAGVRILRVELQLDFLDRIAVQHNKGVEGERRWR